jgi:hypothetical protein
MNKLERFSLHSALKAGKPFFNECFFPITYDKYITFEASALTPALDYKNWQEVIDFMKPFLDRAGIKIIRLGHAKSPEITGVIDHRGKGFNQDAYIISKSSLHLGSERTLSLTAYHFNVKQVCLFSSFESKLYPFKKNKSDKFIDSDKKGRLPSYSEMDTGETVNNISPCVIAERTLSSLKIKNDLGELNHIFAGKLCNTKTIELVPDFSPDPNFLKGSLVNLRADLAFDEQNIFQFSQGRRLGIITDKTLSVELLNAIKGSVSRVSINADAGIEESFIKNLNDLNIAYEIFVSKKDILSEIRLKFIDEIIEYYPKTTKKDVDFSIDSSYSNLINSSKILISKGKNYASKAHWITGKEIKPGLQEFIDTSDFWEDIDFMNIYSIKQNNGSKNK